MAAEARYKLSLIDIGVCADDKDNIACSNLISCSFTTIEASRVGVLLPC